MEDTDISPPTLFSFFSVEEKKRSSQRSGQYLSTSSEGRRWLWGVWGRLRCLIPAGVNEGGGCQPAGTTDDLTSGPSGRDFERDLLMICCVEDFLWPVEEITS